MIELTNKQWFMLFVLVLLFIAIGGVAAFISASLLAFIPAYGYLRSIRNSEKYGKEPWEALRIAFVWGALSGVFLAILLSAIGTPLLLLLLTDLTDPSVQDILPIFVGAVIIAPIAEEIAKPLVMLQNERIKKEIDEIEDGIVYGAACGLGFGATENVMYGLTEGLAAAGFAGMAFLIIIRTVSSILLHLVTTSFTGHGIARYLINGEPFSVVAKYYLVAVIIHGTWNLAAIYSLVYGSETGGFLIFLFSILLAIAGLQLAKKRIAVLDGATAVLPVSESLPPESGWGEDKWNRESKWDNRSTQWDAKKQEEQTNGGSQASTLYSAESATAVGSDIDWKSTIGTIVFLLFIAFNILEVII